MKRSALVITYHDSENYGAFLQAFAMQEFLKECGVDVEILGYRSKTVPVLTVLYRFIKGHKKPSVSIQGYHEEMAHAIMVEQRKLNISDGRKYHDITILGSDEIWNVKNIGAAHDPFLFLKNKRSRKTISYAACSGDSTVKHLKLLPYAIKGIKGLDAVSVRDEATQALMEHIGRTDAVRVLDPTFLIDWSRYIPDWSDKGNGRPYIFVYSYGLLEDQIREIIGLAQDRGLAVIATGTACDWADENPVPTPFEWITYIKNAKFVVTSTFHGIVLSIQMRKNFAVFDPRSPKIYSILKELHLLDRRVTEWNTLDRLYDDKIDHGKKEAIIWQKIKRSKDFIVENLGMIPSFEESSSAPEDRCPDVLKRPCYIVRHRSSAVRWASRSGGAFTAISDIILKEGGIVYGAVLDKDFITSHIRACTKEDRDRMRGSKYVQSDMTKALPLVKEDLQAERIVLFTGTPCQVDAVVKLAELLNRKEYLTTIDFICHGVPSPMVWKDHLNQYSNITMVDFRDKKTFGWGEHLETVVSDGKPIHSRIFTSLYYQDYINRPSCHECPYAKYEHYSDITIGDCWGVENLAKGFNDDDSGVSMAFANSDKGSHLLKKAIKDMDVIEKTIGDMRQPVMRAQGMGASMPNRRRREFWGDYKDKGIRYVIPKYLGVSKKQKVKDVLRPPHFFRFAVKKALGRN